MVDVVQGRVVDMLFQGHYFFREDGVMIEKLQAVTTVVIKCSCTRVLLILDLFNFCIRP